MLLILVGMLLITVVAEAGHCKPGTEVLSPDGCETCYCSEDGIYTACTARDCSWKEHSLAKRHVSRKKRRECTPGETFIPNGECNYCICSEKGHNTYTCTRRICNVVRSAKDEPCKSKKKKFKSKDRCNTCTCENRFAMCTMKYCGK
uniref:Protease inhibitor n=1 Tax=Panstrongylus lignarius TaxID=156445 RepID=A0A224XS68_9HEMI